MNATKALAITLRDMSTGMKVTCENTGKKLCGKTRSIASLCNWVRSDTDDGLTFIQF